MKDRVTRLVAEQHTATATPQGTVEDYKRLLNRGDESHKAGSSGSEGGGVSFTEPGRKCKVVE